MLGLVLYNGSFLCTLITYQLCRGSPCYIRETHMLGLVLYNGSFLCTLITYQLSRGCPCYIPLPCHSSIFIFPGAPPTFALSTQEPHPLLLSAHRSPTHFCSQHTGAPPTFALSTQEPHPLMLSAHRSPTHSC